jgi:hypothetical protein
VPVDVVTDPAKATYVLKASSVEIQKESTGGKVARCIFMNCAGIEDKGNVSVQLVDVSSSRELWAYAVNKQRGGKNEQSRLKQSPSTSKSFLTRSSKEAGNH